MKRRFVLAITGASGAAYAIRLVDVLTCGGCDVHLTISPSAARVLEHELDLHVDLDDFDVGMLRLADARHPRDPKLEQVRKLAGVEQGGAASAGTRPPGEVVYHHYRDLMAPVASGSCLTDGMVICPCSGGTLSAIVHGTSTNLIHRAAEVHFKERRRLVLVPRETPLSLVQLDNMRRAIEAGAIVLPAMPGFYHGVNAVQDLVDFVVARICDQLGVANDLVRRWGATGSTHDQ